MKTRAHIWTVHTTVTRQERAAPTQAETVGLVVAKKRVPGSLRHACYALIRLLTRDTCQVSHGICSQCPLQGAVT